MAETKKRRFIPYATMAGLVIGVVLDAVIHSFGALIVTGIVVGALVDLVIFLVSRGHLDNDDSLS